MLSTSKNMICHCCGQLKPETAFGFDMLSKNYSTVCKECQSQGNSTTSDSDASGDDHNKEELRYQLDNKARIKISQDRMQHFKERQALEKQLHHKKAEEFIEANFKRTLLSNAAKDRSKLLNEKPKAATPASSPKQATVNVKAPTQTKQQQSEEPKPISSLTFHFVDAPTAGMVAKSYGSLFGRFRDYLGRGAPINKILSQYNQQFNRNPSETVKKPDITIKESPKPSLVTQFIKSLNKKS
jgi:DNA primase